MTLWIIFALMVINTLAILYGIDLCMKHIEDVGEDIKSEINYLFANAQPGTSFPQDDVPTSIPYIQPIDESGFQNG